MLRDSVLYEIKDQWKNDALVPTIDKCIIFFHKREKYAFFQNKLHGAMASVASKQLVLYIHIYSYTIHDIYILYYVIIFL